MKRTVNRIPYLVAGLIVAGMGGYLLGWSYYRDAIGQIFPMWSQGELSLPFTIHNVTVCLMLLVAGQALKKLSNRTVIVIGGLSLIIGFSLIPFIPKENPTGALVMLVICYGVVAAISPAAGTAAGYDAFLAWFPERQGFVSGLLTFFCGIAPILVGFLCGLLLGPFDILGAIRAIGIILGVLILLASLWAKLPGPDVELPQGKSADQQVASVDYTPGEMLRTGSFWCIFLFTVAGRSAGLIVSDLGGTIGIALGVGALAGMLFSPASGIACIVGGYILDRLGFARTMCISGAVLAAGGALLLAGDMAGSTPMVILGLALVGVTYGGVTVLNIGGTRILFGARDYSRNLGFVLISILPAAGSVFLSGSIITASGGSYRGVFLLILALAVVGLVVSLLMFPAEKARLRSLPVRAPRA